MCCASHESALQGPQSAVPRNLHPKVFKVLCLTRNLHLRSTKRCSCKSIFAKCCTCREICMPRFTLQSLAKANHSNSPSKNNIEMPRRSFRKVNIQCTCRKIRAPKYYACHEICKPLGSPAPVTKSRLRTTKTPENAHSTTTRAVPKSTCSRPPDSTSLRSGNALRRS